MKPVYNVDADDKTLAVYATDGTLRVYDRTTGAILTDVNVDSVENQDSAQVWAVGEGYALVKPAEGVRDTQTLRSGDQVIATSGELYDGKVIR